MPISKKSLHKEVISGGEMGIRTPEAIIIAYMISNHAPSANSDISPNNIKYYIKKMCYCQIKLKNLFISIMK